MSIIRETIRGFWQSRRARYQADALRYQAEARLHERRRALAAKPHKSASEVMEQGVLESTSAGLLMGWGDSMGVWKDYLQQMTDFSRGGLGVGAGITSKRGRRGGDYPFVTSEAHLLAHIDFSRLVWQNPNVQGLAGGRRRYALGSGATVRAVPRGDSAEAKDAAARAQRVLDEFGRANRFAFRQRSFFDRASRDGEGIWRLFPQEDGTTLLRTVYSEQLRCPPGENPDQYEYGICTDPDDAETVIEYAVWSLNQYHQEPERVPPEEIVYHGPNRDDGVKRSLPDWTLTTGEIAELSDDLASNMGEGSKLQAAIAYIMQHTGVPASTIQARGFADASYTKTDPWTGKDIPVRKLAPGTVVETNQNTEFLGSPYNAGIDSHANVFKLLCNRMAARWNAPSWLGTAFNDEVNYASALEASAPFVLTTLETQESISEPFRVAHERALAVAAAVGREGLPRNVLDLVEVKVTCPNPVARNQLQEAQRAEIELRSGTTSPQHEAELQGREWPKVVADRKQAMAQGWQPEGQGQGGGGGDRLNPAPRVPGSSVPGGGSLGEQLERIVREALYESGFTGTDRLGRRWVDGKEVKKDDAGDRGDNAGGGKGTGGKETKAPADAPKEAHVWGEIHDDLPDEVKSDPGLVAKVRRVTAVAYEAVWGFLAEHGAGLVPEVLDTAEDYAKISYHKLGAQGQAQHDPFYVHTGVPYSVIAGVVSKGIAAAAAYVKGRLSAREALEAMAGDDRRQVAEAVVELFKRLWEAIGVQATVPTADQVLARMAERAT